MWRRRESNPITGKSLTGWRCAISDASGCRMVGYRPLRHSPRVHWSPPEFPPSRGGILEAAGQVPASWVRQTRLTRPT